AYGDEDSDDAISNDEGDKNQNSNIFGDDDDAEDGREHQVNEDPIKEGEEDKQGMENNNTQGKEDATGLNKNDKESVQPKHIEEVSDSVSSSHFKKLEVPKTGGSILQLLDDVVKVGQVMGYKMEGCMKNMAEIIETQRVKEVFR
nr:RNA-directed DNA polymerase, eukaryota [Tanacetum cinerariifolium]